MVRSVHQLVLSFNNFFIIYKDEYSEEFLLSTMANFSSLWYLRKFCVAVVLLAAGLLAPITAQYVALTPTIIQSG